MGILSFVFKGMERKTEKLRRKVLEEITRRLEEDTSFLPELMECEQDKRIRSSIIREEAYRRVYGSPYPIRLNEEKLALLYSWYEEDEEDD